MSKSRLLLVLLAVFTSTAVWSQQRYQSLLWKVTSPGSKKVSYLYGTMHISGKLAFQLGDPFYDALESADVVALELEPEEWLDALQSDPNSSLAAVSDANELFDYNQFDYDSPLPALEGFYRLDTDLRSRLSATLSNDPGILNYLLFRFGDGESSPDFEEDTWLDMHIYQTAKKMGKATLGLETYAQSDEFMIKASLAEFEEMSNQPWAERDFREMNQLQGLLEPAYRNQDLDLVDSLNRITTSKAFRKYILDERSALFAQALDSLMRSGKSAFAAMGCAHLPGEAGVIEILRRQGYSVMPVNKGERNAKRRKAYEKMVFTPVFRQHTTVDGRLSFQTPAKVYPLATSNSEASWISLDIANGASFTFTRLKSYAKVMKLTNTELLTTINELIYESVAGELVSTTSIRFDNYSGIEIVSRTRRGDYHRQRILVLPDEIVLLKLTAPGDLAIKDYGSDFFEKLSYKAPASNDDRWISPDGVLSARLPGNRVFYPREGALSAEADLEVISSDDLSDAYYLIQRHVIDDPQFIDEDRYELKRLLRAYSADRMCTVMDTSWTQVQGLPALDATLQGDYGELRVRFVLRALEYYAFCTNHPSAQAVADFWNSIEFKQQQTVNLMTYSNEELHFKVVLPYEPLELGLSAEMMKFNPELERDPNSPFGTNGDYAMSMPGSGTTLNVTFQRYHEFSDGESKESFQRERRDRILGLNMSLVSSQEQWSDSGAVFTYVVEGTGSVRRYMHKILLHNKSCYALSTTYDSLSGPSPWVVYAMETFASTDSAFPYPHFQSRDDAYFNALLSADSTSRKKALAITSEMDFTAQSAKRIPAVLDSLSGYSSEERQIVVSKLIQGLSADSTLASIDFIRREFRSHSDSSAYQEALLASLLEMKSTKAMQAYRELVLEEPPIVLDWNSSCWLLLDSVRLSSTVLKDLKQLLAIDEYREPIYRVMAQAVDSGWYASSDYAGMLPQILLEAKNELKRLNANDETGYAFNTSVFMDYAALLQPFRNRKDVTAFFAKAQTTKRTKLLLDLIAFDLQHKQPIADTLIQRVARDKEFIHPLYVILRQHNQTNRMPSEIRSREDLIRAYVKQVNSPEFMGVADSVMIVSSYTTAIRLAPVRVYFCKVYLAEFDEWLGRVIAFDDSEKDHWWPMFIASDADIRLESGKDEYEVMQLEFERLVEQHREVVSFGYGGDDFVIQQY